jgi:hypothetical protein
MEKLLDGYNRLDNEQPKFSSFDEVRRNEGKAEEQYTDP